MADPLWDKASLDPSVIAGKGGLRNTLLQAFLQNGDTSMLTPEMMAQWGITAADIAPAATNPYSQKALLGQQLAQDQGQIRQTAQSHGAQFSGAHAAAQAREVRDANQRNYASQQGLLGTLNTVGTQYTDLITGAYKTLMGQAATDPTIPAAPVAPAPAPAPAPVAPSPALNGLGNPYVNPGPRESLIQPPKIKVPKPVPVGIHAQ